MQLEFGVSQVSESRLAHAAIEFVNARAFELSLRRGGRFGIGCPQPFRPFKVWVTRRHL
jgi:hypothetical protein